MNPTHLVLAHFGLDVLCESLTDGDIASYKRLTSLRPLAGDKVVITNDVVDSILPRHNTIERLRHKRHARPVCANTDIIGIVITSEPTAPVDFIDAWILAALTQKAQPLLILNKSDLSSFDHWQATIIERFKFSNVDHWQGSVLQPDSIKKLLLKLLGKTIVFVGLSGVGKSSLTNVLIEGIDIKTQSLSSYSGYGVHTTTHTMLHPFPNGGGIIDAPGVREIDIAIPKNLEIFWHEFAPYLNHCKFRDCRHENEPECAIRQAVEEGNIHPDRYRSYHRLRKTLGKLNPWEKC